MVTPDNSPASARQPSRSAISAAEAATITARAEFRVFGRQVIETIQRKMWDAGATLQKIREMPEETYFISRHSSDANVKVRDSLLDIKLKTGETPEGYEIFQPAGKFRFPVSRADLARILGHLRVGIELDQESIAYAEFLSMAKTHPDLVPVSVEKLRFGFAVDGVTCEYARVWFNGAQLETACCESEDPASMKRVIEALGIAALPNTSYLKAAKRVIGMT